MIDGQEGQQARASGYEDSLLNADTRHSVPVV